MARESGKSALGAWHDDGDDVCHIFGAPSHDKDDDVCHIFEAPSHD